jgi:hypothetical protein
MSGGARFAVMLNITSWAVVGATYLAAMSEVAKAAERSGFEALD